MTAIDELRHLLDERGVAHSDHYLSTTWRDGHGILHLAGEPMADGSLVVDMLTPEQAIAATLGGGECEDRAEAFTLLTNGTVCVGSKQLVARIAELQSRLNKVALDGRKLTAEQVRECAEKVYLEGYSDGSVNRGAHIEETDWQAIADELNAELGSGTCKITATATNNLMYPDYMTKWYELSCGHSLTLNCDEAPKWCAVCGKAVER